jgi:hypothetical protein
MFVIITVNGSPSKNRLLFSYLCKNSKKRSSVGDFENRAESRFEMLGTT